MAEQALVKTEAIDGVIVLSFHETVKNISEDMLPEVTNQLLAPVYKNPARLVVDLSGVEFFGSSFVEVLFRVWNKMKDRKKGFALCCLTPYCREIFTVTNLDKLWKIYATRQEALQGTHAAP